MQSTSYKWLLAWLTLLLTACVQAIPASSDTGVTVDAETATTAATPADTANGDDEEMNVFPLTVENCGLAITYDAPPERAVTMNQAATEIMLALGLEGRMVGTAYLDDEVLPDYQRAYASIPVLAAEYPSQEVLLAAEPDFVYGAYRSAFAEEAAGGRETLLDLGIRSYLSAISCEEEAERPAKMTFATVYAEMRDIGRIFGVEERAEALTADMQATLNNVLATIGDNAEPVTIFWYDSGADEPFAGACCGAPNMILEAVGATNIFADAEGNWATVNWESVVDRNPQVIVVIDAAWDTAQQKIDLLQTDPVYSSIDAVQNGRFIILPFSATTLGVRNVAAVAALAKELYPEKFD
jgi:iron complex transport system substrate-binding protein